MPDGNVFFEKLTTAQWIHDELKMPQGELLRKAKVVGLSKDGNGNEQAHMNQIPYSML